MDQGKLYPTPLNPPQLQKNIAVMRNVVPRLAAKNLWAVGGQEIFAFYAILVTFQKRGEVQCEKKKIPHVNPLETQAQEVTLAKKHFPIKTNF